MTTLAYFLFDPDNRKGKPQDEIIGEAHRAEYWFAEMTSSETISALERRRFSDLYKFARKGDTLAVASIQCLSRCNTELFEIFQALRAKGVDVVSVLEGFRLSSPSGKAYLKILAEFSAVRRAATSLDSRNRKKS